MKRFLGIFWVLLLLNVAPPLSGAPDWFAEHLNGVAYADAPAELSKFEEKLNDVASLIRKVLYVFVILGVMFAGMKFLQGDPQAWKFTIGVVIGATLIYTAEGIVGWLAR